MNLDRLKLESVVSKKPPIDVFEIVVTWTHGDADHRTSESIFGDREKLDDFYMYMDKYYSFSHNERIRICRDGGYSTLPGFWVFVYVDSKKEYEENEHPGWFDSCWPNDVTYRDIRARIDYYEVFYYDESGAKFKVRREE